MNACNQVVCV